MSEIHLDPQRFLEGCEKLYAKWEENGTSDAWGNTCDALVVMTGTFSEEEIRFPKCSALQVEMSDTLIAFCQNEVVFLASAKKAKFMQELAENLKSFPRKLTILTRDKSDNDASNFNTVLSALRSSKQGKKVGTLTREVNKGAFADEWAKVLQNSGLLVCNIFGGLSELLAVKTNSDLQAVREGCEVAVQLMKKHVIQDILNIIDDQKEITMMSLMDGVEERIFEVAKDHKVMEADLEVITAPMLQSGGRYNLKYTAQTPDGLVHLPDKDVPAVHIISVSLRHKFCCCTVARTLFFNVRKDHAENYKLLLEVFEECLAMLKPGVRISKVYEKSLNSIQARKPDLLNHFVKEIGWGMGYELRDKWYIIDEKNRQCAEKGMVFCLRMGFENLKIPSKDVRSQQYSLLLSDTVIIGDSDAQVITNGLSRKFSKNSWNVSDEPTEDVSKEKEKEAVSAEEILARLEKNSARSKETEDAERRKQFEEQNEKLARRRVEEQKRLISGSVHDDEVQNSRTESQTTGYNGPEDFPLKASGSSIYVDEEHQTVFLPINGLPVPFHISFLKNVAKQEQGPFSVLRVNFVTPGLGIPTSTVDKGLMYLRELSFRSTDSASLGMAHKQIMDMKKHFNQSESLERARAQIVPQEPLRLSPHRGPQLQNIRIFPNPQARGKKTEGTLEAHVNGFRFTVKKAPSPDLRHIDFLYRNIKHAFFQPSNKSSSIILIHFRLINPIMVGKTSTKDLQFYVEYMDEGESLLDSGRRHRLGWDHDEIEDENRTKHMVAQLDAEFKKFCDRVSELLPLANPSEPEGDKIWYWDIPYHELEFHGNPKNSLVELYPTTSCIVHLTTKPVCIIELERVDVVYYERIQSGNRNFDLVFVFKDFLLPDTKIAEGTAWTRVSSIDMKYYDQVREILQKSKLPQFEGIASLKWNDVLKQYRKNFEDITQDGGWVCIFGHGEDDDEEESEEEEDDESFTAGDNEDESSEEESDESELSEYSESDVSSEESLSSEGMDSDEAEKWAEEEDKRGRERNAEKPGKMHHDVKRKKVPLAKNDENLKRPKHGQQEPSSKDSKRAFGDDRNTGNTPAKQGVISPKKNVATGRGRK